MDADLRSIAQARQTVTAARAAFDKFRGTSQETIDRIVEAMVVAIEPECGRLERWPPSRPSTATPRTNCTRISSTPLGCGNGCAMSAVWGCCGMTRPPR